MENHKCPYCGAENVETKVVPFNRVEGISVGCITCFERLATETVVEYGIAKLKKLEDAGYFADDELGDLIAVTNFIEYVYHLKEGSPEPFVAAGSLIIADESSASS